MTDILDDELVDRERLASHVARLIETCEQYAEEQKPARDRALEYYEGKLSDLPAEEGRSKVVSKDVRTVVKKLMPSVMRTLLSNDKIVEYEPIGPGDEDDAAQATDYVNHAVVEECGAEAAIHDAVFDALVVKTGILKWVAYKRRRVTVATYTNQQSDALLGLEGEPGVEIEILSSRPETNPDVLAADPNAERHDFRLRRTEERIDIRLEAVPRGSFLMAPGADDIETAPIVGERQKLTRSELVSRGYDRDVVAGLSAEDGDNDDFSDDMARSGDDWTDLRAETAKAMEEVLVYEVYVWLDLDGDGIAELHKICLAEGGDETGIDDRAGRYVILDIEPVDEAPYAKVVAEREAHQFEGRSAAEDVEDVERIKTALLRESLDNIYWQNRKQPAVDPSQLTEDGIDAVYEPAFGKPITLKPGGTLAQAVQWMDVPFVADRSLAMMEYMDTVARDRTGITDASGGVNPELFQDMTKFAAGLISESGIAQAEMIIRSLARGGIKRAFKGLLKLIITHADQPRTIRLRGKWVEYDPRYWNAGMDCTVNVGLGAGTKERDLAVLQMVLGLQEKLLMTIGADNPFVRPEQLYNVLAKIVETAGFPSADPYFTKPDPQAIAAKMQQGQGPSEAEKKLQAQMQLEQVKAQTKSQIEQAQMAADLRVKQAELEKDAQIQVMKAELQKEIALMKGEIDLLKHRESLALEREKLGLSVIQSAPFTSGELYNVE